MKLPCRPPEIAFKCLVVKRLPRVIVIPIGGLEAGDFGPQVSKSGTGLPVDQVGVVFKIMLVIWEEAESTAVDLWCGGGGWVMVGGWG